MDEERTRFITFILDDAIQKVFHAEKGDYDIEVPPLHKKHYYDVRITINNTNKRLLPCVIMVIMDNLSSIHVDLVSKCDLNGTTLSGANVLRIIKDFGKYIGVKSISLEDMSRIEYDGDGSTMVIGDCSMSLASFKLFTTGISWYNKYGFISESYDQEIEENERIRNMSTVDYLIENQISSEGTFTKLFPHIDTQQSIGLTVSILGKFLNDQLDLTKGTDQIGHIDCNSEQNKYIFKLVNIFSFYYDNMLTWTNPDYDPTIERIPKELQRLKKMK